MEYYLDDAERCCVRVEPARDDLSDDLIYLSVCVANGGHAVRIPHDIAEQIAYDLLRLSNANHDAGGGGGS